MTPPTKSPFLDILPAELRLRIYSQLLVASEPLRGPVARQNDKYDLDTAILRTNKQVYDEARSVFLGKNTFYITSVPPTTTSNPSSSPDCKDKHEEDGSGALEPPLQLVDLPLVRHLEIDLLYHPNTLYTITDSKTGGWRPMCVGGERYITSLSYLLNAVESTLLTLKICADTRRHIASPPQTHPTEDEVENDDEKEEEEEELDIHKLLTGPYIADGSPRFKKALQGLDIERVGLHFDFPESSFDFVMEKEVLARQSLVDLTGQVLMARSGMGLESVLGELGEGCGIADQGSVSLMPR